jgi:hypothetical protein
MACKAVQGHAGTKMAHMAEGASSSYTLSLPPCQLKSSRRFDEACALFQSRPHRKVTTLAGLCVLDAQDDASLERTANKEAQMRMLFHVLQNASYSAIKVVSILDCHSSSASNDEHFDKNPCYFSLHGRRGGA